MSPPDQPRAEATSPWARLLAQARGDRVHRDWIAVELPAAVPWLVRWNRLIFFVLLPLGLLTILARALVAGLGVAPPVVIAISGMAMGTAYLGSGTLLAAIVGVLGARALLRGDARSPRLVGFVAGSLCIVVLAAYLVVAILRMFSGT